ncbi:MAG TPA: DUF559 domain-containing protein [Ruania sp.]|nr:DUF559 domain-containing protein [Ruania sp.]
MTRPAPLPDPFLNTSFAVGTAQNGGLTRSRLRANDLTTPFHGVRSHGLNLDSFVDRCRACQERMHPEQFFSHTTAAHLLGLPLPGRLRDTELEVTSLAPRRPMRTAGVRGHEMSASSEHRLWVVDGLRTVDPVSAWLQLAPRLDVRALVVAGDALLRRQRPYASATEVTRRVRNNRGRRGQIDLNAALGLLRANTDSPRETELRLDIVAAGLPEPEVNPRIFAADGRFIAYGDLAYSEYKVLVEYDGEQHRTSDQQFGRDVARLNALIAEGWIVIRVTKAHWASRHEVSIPEIRRALESRGWR